MKTEDTDIQWAKGLLQAHKRRQATIDHALTMFEEADAPEQRAKAARYLIGVTEHADVEFIEHMAKVSARITNERRALAALGGLVADS